MFQFLFISALVGILIMITIILIYVLAVSFIIWMIVDAAKNNKYWWIVLIIGIPVIGAIIYYFVEKKGDYLKIKK